MAVEIFSRYELKYIISDELFRIFKKQLDGRLEADKYCRHDSFYTICNIYYDTADNEIIRKSIDKPVYKEKIRLRSYGVVKSDDIVFFEIKKKYDGCVFKRRTELTLAEAYNYINGGKMPEARDELDRLVKNEIDFFVHKYKSLMPKVFISYDRIAMYGITDKSFRVTFDSNIRTRRYDLSLDKGIYGDLLMPADCWLMEVKTKDSIPLWFARLLSKYRIYPVSFSKYGTEYKNFITGCKDEKVEKNVSRLYA